MRTSTRAILGLVVAAVMGGGVAPASAKFDTSFYSYRKNSPVCTGRTDPVSVVFYGYAAYAEGHGHSHLVFDRIVALSEWEAATGGSQYIASSGNCTATEYQNATACGGCNRYHVRLNQTHEQDSRGRFETVGTPHYDQAVQCDGTFAHAVPPDRAPTERHDSGFDEARGKVKNDWKARYGSSTVGDIANWGNTAEMKQCNGWRPASSGRVYWLKTD